MMPFGEGLRLLMDQYGYLADMSSSGEDPATVPGTPDQQTAGAASSTGRTSNTTTTTARDITPILATCLAAVSSLKAEDSNLQDAVMAGLTYLINVVLSARTTQAVGRGAAAASSSSQAAVAAGAGGRTPTATTGAEKHAGEKQSAGGASGS